LTDCRQRRDGLQADWPNENQGAESTLAFLESLLELRLAENIDQSNEHHHNEQLPIRDGDKVVFPDRYIFASDRDTTYYSSYFVVDTKMVTAGVRTLLRWLTEHAPPLSAARIPVNIRSSSGNE
jgi:hypothetical protein